MKIERNNVKEKVNGYEFYTKVLWWEAEGLKGCTYRENKRRVEWICIQGMNENGKDFLWSLWSSTRKNNKKKSSCLIYNLQILLLNQYGKVEEKRRKVVRKCDLKVNNFINALNLIDWIRHISLLNFLSEPFESSN